MAVRLLSTNLGGGGGGGTGDVVGPASSADNEIVLFDGTSGKLIKAATGTGVVHATNGVYSVGVVTISEGGTGQVTATAAFNALSPCTTKGDTMVHNGTNVVRLAIGNNGASYYPDAGVTNGLRWLNPEEYDNGNLGSSKTIDMTQSDVQRGTLNSAVCAITLSNGISGRLYRLRFLQDSTGQRRFYFTNTVQFVNGTYANIPYNASDFGTLYLWTDGTTYFASSQSPYNLSLVTNSYCASLNGTSQYVSVANNNAWTVGTNVSISCWVNRSVVGVRQDLMAHFKATGNSDGFLFGIGFIGGASINKLAVYGANTSASFQVADTGSNIAVSTWTHVAMTYNGTNVKFYQNGAFTSAPNFSGALSITNAAVTLNIGASTNSPVDSYLTGKIDEVCIFNVALTNAEMTELYAMGRPYNVALHSQNSALQGWWRMGDSGDTTATIQDRSGNSRDGTPQNFTNSTFVTTVFSS